MSSRSRGVTKVSFRCRTISWLSLSPWCSIAWMSRTLFSTVVKSPKSFASASAASTEFWAACSKRTKNSLFLGRSDRRTGVLLCAAYPAARRPQARRSFRPSPACRVRAPDRPTDANGGRSELCGSAFVEVVGGAHATRVRAQPTVATTARRESIRSTRRNESSIGPPRFAQGCQTPRRSGGPIVGARTATRDGTPNTESATGPPHQALVVCEALAVVQRVDPRPPGSRAWWCHVAKEASAVARGLLRCPPDES